MYWVFCEVGDLLCCFGLVYRYFLDVEVVVFFVEVVDGLFVG